MNRAEVKRRQAGEIANILLLAALWAAGQAAGNSGVAYMVVGVEVCALLWCAVGGSLSETLGKLLRGRRNKGQYKNAARMRSAALVFHGFLGLVGSLLLLLFGGQAAEGIFGVRYSTYIIMFLSPVILLRALSSCILGYFQGEGMEFPTAAAGVLRQVMILGFGLLFARLMGDYGEKVSNLLLEKNFAPMYGGMGFALGVVLAELLVVVILALLYKGSRLSEKRSRQDGLYSTDSFWDCVGYLCGGRWPQALTFFLELLPLALGAAAFGRADGGAPAQYGAYAGQYLVICGMAVCLASVSVLPVSAKVFSSLRREETRFARTAFESGVHICVVHGVFGSLFLTFMAEQVTELLNPEGRDTLLSMLRGGSFLILAAALCSYFGRFLLSSGKRYHVLGAVGISDLFFLAVMVFTGGTEGGALSLVYGSLAGMAVLCILLGLLSCSQMRMRLDWLNVLAVPAGAGAAGVPAVWGRALSSSGDSGDAYSGSAGLRGGVLGYTSAAEELQGAGTGGHSRWEADPYAWTDAACLLRTCLIITKKYQKHV